MTFLVVLAAHQGEEFVIILPAVMLVGAFFIMRWANQSDETATGAQEAEELDLAEAAAGAAPARRDSDTAERSS